MVRHIGKYLHCVRLLPLLQLNSRLVGNFHEKAGKVNAPLLAHRFLVCNRRIAPLPSALFVELFAPVPVGVLDFNGCCHLGTELNASVPRSVRSWPTPQSPELDDWQSTNLI